MYPRSAHPPVATRNAGRGPFPPCEMAEGAPLRLGLAAFMAVVVLARSARRWSRPYDPTQQSLRERLKAPTCSGGGGSVICWHGPARSRHSEPDHLRFSGVADRRLCGRPIGGAIGGSLGLLSGYAGGIVDEIVMLLVDAQLAFPFILLAIGIIAVLGPSFGNLIVIVGLSGWVTYARLVRAKC